MRTIVVLFNRDLRVHDHPALATACRDADRVVPLFVLDDGITNGRFGAPNRVAFLIDCLGDLRQSLRERGGTLIVRSGDVVDETLRIVTETHAAAIYTSADHTGYARRRERRLRDACGDRLDLRTFPGVAIVDPGTIAPAGGDAFRVFTPYWRRWSAVAKRNLIPVPRRVVAPRMPAGALPPRPGATAPNVTAGGEREGRRRLSRWLSTGLAAYEAHGNDLPADATSHLSPFLHFGALSPTEILTRVGERGASGDAFVRELCWRDFFLQVIASEPSFASRDYRRRNGRWRRAPADVAAWKEGRTGIPIVDAGMRQLLEEGWMPNRARLITASFLTKTLGIDWRDGARHFWDHLVDGDVASNAGNWQWVAGTGNDPRPNRVLNPIRQALRFDADGAYVRRHVAELSAVDGSAVHRPWRLPAERTLGYPAPIVDVT